MWKNKYFDDDFCVRDGVLGVVTGRCKTGVFLLLENGQEAFASFGWLNPGTEVLCTVFKKATERWRVLVVVDAVVKEAASMAA